MLSATGKVVQDVNSSKGWELTSCKVCSDKNPNSPDAATWHNKDGTCLRCNSKV